MSDADSNRMARAIEALNQNRLLRILAPLIHKGTYLRPAGPGGVDGYGYGKIGAESAEVDACVSEADARALLAQDLIERHSAGFRISAAGRAWLKRQLAAGDRFQGQHSVRSVKPLRETAGDALVLVNDAESPLAWLARRTDKAGNPLIAQFQFAAGERLRADYTYAALSARVTAGYDAAFTASKAGGGGGAAHLSDTVLAARQRVTKALAAVGPELAGVLVDVCCHLKGLEDAEKQEGWPKRSGKIVLQIALTRLARHYGLVSDGQAIAGLRRRLQHWGTADYKPRIDSGEPYGAAEAC